MLDDEGNVFFSTLCARSAFVAAITRMSTGMRALSPTRVTSWLSSARSTFACAASGMSLTSSRNSVPSFEASKCPTRRSIAPVKLPF